MGVPCIILTYLYDCEKACAVVCKELESVGVESAAM